jgi:hypothetical protein
VCVANSREQARLFVEHALAIVKASPGLRSLLVSETADALEFQGGKVLAAFPCSSRSARGWAISCLVLDEFAHFLDLSEGPAVAARVWQALTPSVAQFSSLGRIIVISSPYGENLFSELYAKARSGELPNAAAFHATTQELNPDVDDDYLAQQRVALGEDEFASEYLAEFRAGGQPFIESAALRACVEERRELLPDDGEGWVLALDPAFSSDPTAVAIVGRDRRDASKLVLGRAQRWLPDRTKKRKTRREQDRFMHRVLDEVAELATRYRADVVSDQHLPGTVQEELTKRGVRVVQIAAWTAASRSEAFRELRSRIYTGRIGLYEEPTLTAELLRLRTRFRAGSAVVEVPRVGDSHGDMAVALALAVRQHAGSLSAFTLSVDHLVPAMPVPAAWERLEALSYTAGAGAWLGCAVDYSGNLIVLDVLDATRLPSEVAPLIAGRGLGGAIYANPELFGGRAARHRRMFGEPLVTADEFSYAGLSLVQGNGDALAGLLRVRELLRCDAERVFPSWHPRAGETGSPRLFIVDGCRELVAQLRAAKLAEGELDESWEQDHGRAVAALRIAAMTRPAPSKEPPKRENAPIDPDEQRRDWLVERYRSRDERRRRDRSTYVA